MLKGYAVSDYGGQVSVLAYILRNKVQRLIELSGRQICLISFDEFLCLYDLLVLQYQKIYIIENPIYHTFYPVNNVVIGSEISDALLAHFDQDANTDVNLVEIGEYTDIYANFIYTNSGLACRYNYDDALLIHEKIERYLVPFSEHVFQQTNILPDGYEYVNICTETDYYGLAEQLRLTTKHYAVTCDHFVLGKSVIQRHVHALGSIYGDRILWYIPKDISQKAELPSEIFSLMQKYWGYTPFRKFKIYDLDALEQSEKKVKSVSQGQIIADLIEQVEHCVRGENFRDIFVTAPTSAGKSLIFQLSAMYLAKRYDLVTLVITPLIGLMNDQVQQLNQKGYLSARTIHSDISPIVKEQILDEVASGTCNILYLSPESLLSRSDVQQLIGPRRIGMLVVDESHIVTTWGKQFRPDYWYLGDHVQKLRRAQIKRDQDPMPFVIATFTATAIYGGKEDMYHETLNSLHMIDPVTYLGYLKRDNIQIEVSEVDVRRSKTEYEINKFDSLISMVHNALIRSQKVLIYFPTVALINRFCDYCFSKGLSEYVTKYHGQMNAADRDEGSCAFRDGTKPIMAATKAYGMGIDIPDISIVAHFAPTGNVCDYMQEIGRAARDTQILGRAVYSHMSNDFKHINRLHGLSTIRRYQLIEIIKKVLEIYVRTRYRQDGQIQTKKRNELLVDTESFGYIFDSATDSDELVAKVKTAMLLIQKDYENRGFSPFYIRPIPIFAYGYFSVSKWQQEQINKKYKHVVSLVEPSQNICKVELNRIWERGYKHQMSFPKFKFLLYSKSSELDFVQKWDLTTAMVIDVFFDENFEQKYQKIMNPMKKLANESAYSGAFLSQDQIIESISQNADCSRYKAESTVNVILAAMDIYQKEYGHRLNAGVYRARPMRSGKISYSFVNSAREFFGWLEKKKKKVLENTHQQKMYVTNTGANDCKQVMTALGVLEAIGALRFRSLGGSNSQLYIYVNETKTMRMVRDRPATYRNRLLELIEERHEESVRMLTYLFQNELSSDEIWENLENYFLGILPSDLQEENKD